MSPAQLVFRQVHWRWRDVFIALAPLVLLRTAVAVIDTALVPLAPSSLWAPLAVLVVAWAWILVFTLAITRRRIVEWPRLPRRRVVFVERSGAARDRGHRCGRNCVFRVRDCSIWRSVDGEHVSGTDRGVSQSARVDGVRDPGCLGAPVAEEIFFRGMLYNA